MTNRLYRNKGVADIRKIPTPVQVQSNVRGKVYTLKPEWVDYSGVHVGGAIVLDAKETSSKTSFPLEIISEHQYELLKSWHQKGAQSFLLVSFTSIPIADKNSCYFTGRMLEKTEGNQFRMLSL